MDYQAIIVGAGPVGLMLASELALFGVSVCIVERLPQPGTFSKAFNLHPRSLEILGMRGLLKRFMDEGQIIPSGHFSALETRLDFSVLDTGSNHMLLIPQRTTERLLEEHIRSLNVPIYRGMEVVAVRQNDEIAEIVAVGTEGMILLQSHYVIGTDGAGSIVRKQAGIPFEGTDSNITAALGDVTLSNPPSDNLLFVFNQRGNAYIIPLPEDKYRIVVVDPMCTQTPKERPVSLMELSTSLQQLCGTDYGISDPIWMSRFGNATRIAKYYRNGRILLAGDAAHIHFPSGGQGLNVGLQEAMNLGWKLAGEIQGWAPAWLLDSYHSERHPVAEQLLHNTEVQTKLIDFSPAGLELRKTMADLLKFPDANRYLSERISAIGVNYEPDSQLPIHPLHGKRLPDLDILLANREATSLYSLLHAGSYVCLLLEDHTDESAHCGASAPLQMIHATIAEQRSEWADVHAALIRPDGHVAWALSKQQPDLPSLLQKAIHRWCAR
ncbi:monooxygenase [Paenibacillus alvei]|uniref:monooxygenase n=1 Tax=Paenibacillus alvei TaxID=44250 RepID=UPI000287B10B|nr:monooxygenase [Paenibacillus alvei]EJW15963.1 putative aromatic compound monooxygenase YhjG [Paenibacillus alvei DSM 29]MCY9540076.1 monooxygenase [Paenibacillus alvei]MCY9704678.1 monooxygenase [Paenibacillus alvei]MCY9732662.1 monooxygenase [Paenibacillus alvei]MCY9755017.1 monooxygenase [Paenibacillus alvei]